MKKYVQFILLAAGLFSLISDPARAQIKVEIPKESAESCPRVLKQLKGENSASQTIQGSDRKKVLRAMAHYKTEILGGSAAEGSRPYLEKVTAYFKVKSGQVTGYKYSITDGGDESRVDYYYTSKMKLIFARWQNQSPIDYWFCEK